MANVSGSGRYTRRSHQLANQRRTTGPGRPIEALEERRLLSFVSFPVPPAPANDLQFSLGALTAGPDGNLWFADTFGQRILRVAHDGAFTKFPLPKKSDPVAITDGPDGNLWFLDDVLNKVGKITPTGKITEFSIPNVDGEGSDHLSITAGGDGNVWFTSVRPKSFAPLIGRISPEGAITEFAAPANVGTLGPIARGPDGNVWFGAVDQAGSDLLGRVTSSGAISTYPFAVDASTSIFPSFSPINSLINGPGGSLWLSAGNEIDKITTAGKVAAHFKIPASSAYSDSPVQIADLTTDADGNFWFQMAEASSELGRMSPTGTFTNVNIPGGKPFGFTIPTDFGTQIESLSSSGDGDIWFLSSENALVRIDIHNSILASNEYVDTAAGVSTKTTVAQFIDTGTVQPASAYRAMVMFADGTHAAGAIAAKPDGSFVVSVDHAWPLGNSSATVTITNTHDLSQTTTAADYSTGLPLQPIGTAIAVSPVAGKVFTGNIARFTQVDSTSLGKYYASIDWGDGQFGEGNFVADGVGAAFVIGTHTYASPGNYKIQIYMEPPFDIFPRIPPTGTGYFQTGIAINNAVVKPGVMAGTGYTLLIHTHQVVTQADATFTLADATTDLTHYHATLVWADPTTDAGRPVRAANIIPQPDGQFLVTSPVKFIGMGIASFQIVISDDRKGTGDAAIVGSAYGQILVNYPEIKPPDDTVALPTAVITGTPGNPDTSLISFDDAFNATLTERANSFGKTLTGIAGQTFAGDVGRLAGIVPNAPLQKDLHGTIVWGDGTSSVASFTLGANGGIHIKGSHSYTHAGKYVIKVYLSQTIYQKGKPEGLPDLRLPTVTSSIRIAGLGKK